MTKRIYRMYIGSIRGIHNFEGDMVWAAFEGRDFSTVGFQTTLTYQNQLFCRVPINSILGYI